MAPPEGQIAWAERGIAAAEEAKDEDWLAVLWNNLGATYDWDLKDYGKAVECYRKARHYHYRTGGDQQKLAADWALGKALLAHGKAEEAEPFLAVALERARTRHGVRPTRETREWVGYTEWAWGDLLLKQESREDARAHFKAAREALVAAGIVEWWPDGLTELDKRIAEAARDG